LFLMCGAAVCHNGHHTFEKLKTRTVSFSFFTQKKDIHW
jgi:hypothetical protein